MERHKDQQAAKDLSDVKIDKKEYEERFSSIVNKGFIALSLAVGHKLDLLNALKAASRSPVTSQELAESKKLKERYVREWLGCMVAAEIVFIKFIDGKNRYYIPDEMEFNMPAGLSSFIPPIAQRFGDLLDCFQLDGPAGYSFDRQENVLMALDQEKKNCKGDWLDDKLIPPFLKKDQLKNILDIGCGTGRMTINIALRFPNVQVVGIDPVAFAIETANKSKEESSIKNVKFVKVGAEGMPSDFDRLFDWVVLVETLHDMPNPDESIEGIKKAMKKDGILTVLDPLCFSDHKDNRGIEMAAIGLSLSCFVCLPSSLSCGPAVGNGVGWGLDNRAKFLEDHGFIIKGDKKLVSLVHCVLK